MMKRKREFWDNAPVNPKMNDQPMRIPGYVVPLDDTTIGLKELLLVPCFRASIHMPPPAQAPAN